jgi:transposase
VLESELLDGTKWKSGCFAQDAVGDWWLCLPVEHCVKQTVAPNESVGIDLGLREIAAAGDGRKLEPGRFYRNIEHKIAQAQRRGHKRQAKRLHRQAARRRRDALHKFSTTMVRLYQNIAIGNVSSLKLLEAREDTDGQIGVGRRLGHTQNAAAVEGASGPTEAYSLSMRRTQRENAATVMPLRARRVWTCSR